LLDLPVRDAPGVGKGGQPDLDDLAFAGLERPAVRDADDRVDLRVVGQHDLAAVARLEAPDDTLARSIEHAHDRPGGPRRLSAAPGAARPLLAGEDGVAVQRAVHSIPRNEEVVAARNEHEAEAFGPHGDPPGDEVGELDRRVLLAADAGDLAAALEGVEPL